MVLQMVPTNARTQVLRVFKALRFLSTRHLELPHKIRLGLRYIFAICIKGRNLVVLVREGGIGDLACLLASLPALRNRHPNCWLVVISPIGCRELAAASSLADATAEAG